MLFNPIKYKEPLFRPPAEANSLIFQVAYGCPHNTCAFCGMYKGVKYSIRDKDEVLAEFAKASPKYPQTRRIFLADGDVMALDFEWLKQMLEYLNELFPRLTRVNVYANGSSILNKTPEQLRILKDLKLHTLYVGLETGDEEILKLVHKGETAKEMVDSVRISQHSGLRCSVMVLLGIAGQSHSSKHALATAAILNQMQPRLLSALRYVPVFKGPLFEGYEPLSEYQAVCELRNIISHLDLKKTVFRANHTSNPVPLEGRFPNDKEKLIKGLENLLNSGVLDQTGPGIMPFPGML
jgi:radical SAM superfamily enzyme YgiQ (UPF0313 family)